MKKPLALLLSALLLLLPALSLADTVVSIDPLGLKMTISADWLCILPADHTPIPATLTAVYGQTQVESWITQYQQTLPTDGTTSDLAVVVANDSAGNFTQIVIGSLDYTASFPGLDLTLLSKDKQAALVQSMGFGELTTIGGTAYLQALENSKQDYAQSVYSTFYKGVLIYFTFSNGSATLAITLPELAERVLTGVQFEHGV